MPNGTEVAEYVMVDAQVTTTCSTEPVLHSLVAGIALQYWSGWRSRASRF